MSTAVCEPDTPATAPTESGPVNVRRMSHVFLVDEIEPCLPFWVDRLGFEVRLQVNDDKGLEFVTLGRDEVEIMYRTRSSVHEDAPGLVEGQHGPWVVMYLEVENLENLLPRLEGADVVIPLRQNCFGTQEIFVAEPSGRIVAISDRYAEAA